MGHTIVTIFHGKETQRGNEMPQLIKGFELGEFELAYIECMIWSSQSDDDGSVTGDHSVMDISPEALQQIVDDCKDFRHHNAELMQNLDLAQCGHDFWLTRNGHGAGFWDRGYGKVGDDLTKAAKAYGEQYPYVGDDGLIYLM